MNSPFFKTSCVYIEEHKRERVMSAHRALYVDITLSLFYVPRCKQELFCSTVNSELYHFVFIRILFSCRHKKVYLTLSAQMKNLESIFISFESVQERSNFRHCLPLLKGLQKCRITDMIFHFGDGYHTDNFESFMKHFTKNIPSITR